MQNALWSLPVHFAFPTPKNANGSVAFAGKGSRYQSLKVPGFQVPRLPRFQNAMAEGSKVPHLCYGFLGSAVRRSTTPRPRD